MNGSDMTSLENLPTCSVSEAARRIGVERSKISQMVDDRRLVGFRKEGKLRIPEECLVELPADKQYAVELGQDPEGNPQLVRVRFEPLSTLRGTATVLRDGGFTMEETVRWLWSPNCWLEGRPIDLLRAGSHKKVNRVASSESW